MEFQIELSTEAMAHLRALTARQRAAVTDAIELQLTFEPGVETRNRKQMRPNSVAPWELRIGNLRVYYDIQEDPDPVVAVIAIGLKRGNRVYIGGKEVHL